MLPTRSRFAELARADRGGAIVRRALRRTGRSSRSLAGELTCAILSPGVPPTSPVVRHLHEANVPVLRRDRARLSALQGTDHRGYRNEGQVYDDGADRPPVARLRRAVRVGGNIGNPLIKEVGGTRAQRLGRRRGLVVPARDDSRVQTARRRAAQHRCPIISTATIRWKSTPKRSTGSAPISR